MSDLLILFSAKYLIFFLFLPLIYFWFRGERKLVFCTLASVLLAEVLALLVEALFPTPRPFVVFGIAPPPVFFLRVQTGSFPSGHTAVGVALAVSVMLKRKIWGRFLLLLALIVGVARVLTSAHFWWDILGGIVIGWLCAHLVNRIHQAKSAKLQCKV